MCSHPIIIVFEGTLFQTARSKARLAFGLESTILDSVLGYVQYKKCMNICPSSPNGPTAIVISAWFLSRICPIA